VTNKEVETVIICFLGRQISSRKNNQMRDFKLLLLFEIRYWY